MLTPKTTQEDNTSARIKLLTGSQFNAFLFKFTFTNCWDQCQTKKNVETNVKIG